MADKGPGPDTLIRKRITASIKRLESNIENQELEILETEEKVLRLHENIQATRDAILKEEANLAALDKKQTESDD